MRDALAHPLLDHGRHQAGQRAAQLGNLAHDARAEVRILLRRHHEDGFHPRLHFAIHQRHLQLKFIIADGANAAQHRVRVLPDAIAHQQAVEDVDADIVELPEVIATSISLRSSMENSVSPLSRLRAMATMSLSKSLLPR